MGNKTPHTPEPWQQFAFGEIKDGTSDRDFARHIGKFRSPVDAARAIECVNALAGIKDPAEFMEEWKRTIKTVYDRDIELNRKDKQTEELKKQVDQLSHRNSELIDQFNEASNAAVQWKNDLSALEGIIGYDPLGPYADAAQYLSVRLSNLAYDRDKAKQQRDIAEQQRDELLKALEEYVNIDNGLLSKVTTTPMQRKSMAEAAILKVKQINTHS